MSNQVKVCWVNGSFNQRKSLKDKIIKSFQNASVEILQQGKYAQSIQKSILGDLFSQGNKVFILKQIPHFGQKSSPKSNSKWCEVIDNIPSNTFIIIDDVQPSSRQKIYQHVQKNGKVFTFPSKVKQDVACDIIDSVLKTHGKTIGMQDYTLILNAIKADESNIFDVDMIQSVINLICVYVGKRKKNIQKSDILRCTHTMNGFVIWQLFDYIDNKDYFNARKFIYSYVKNSNQYKPYQALLNLIAWRYKLMFFLKQSQAQNIDKNKIIQNALKISKFQQSGTGLLTVFKAQISKQGQQKSVYSKSMISMLLNGFGQKTALDKFTRTELFKLILIIEEKMLQIRILSQVQSLNAIDQIIMFRCGLIELEHIEKCRRI